MYITKIRRNKGKGKNKEYLVQYLDMDSAEGLIEQFMRFYGLKKVKAGSYFYLRNMNNKSDYDWSVFQMQAFFN